MGEFKKGSLHRRVIITISRARIRSHISDPLPLYIFLFTPLLPYIQDYLGLR
jgi:hypothetical protein